MPIPLLAIFSCGAGETPTPEFDEKDFCKRSIDVLELLKMCGNPGKKYFQ